MSSYVADLAKRGLISTPKWLPGNVHFECSMGSAAYGVSDDTSDFDIYGFAVPVKELVFPHLAGEIPGFGRQIKRFEQFQEHHVNDQEALGGKGRVYDLSIYSIVRYFQLALENNPNLVDSLFVPLNCVLHITAVGQKVRDARRTFLHKGSYHKLRGYSYAQLHKCGNKMKSPEMEAVTDFESRHGLTAQVPIGEIEAEVEWRRVGAEYSAYARDDLARLGDDDLEEYRSLVATGIAKTTRFEALRKHGTDAKFLYHVVRLLDQAEQILETGDLVLGRNREQLKAIRRGDISEKEVREYFALKEVHLQELYAKSTLRHGPDEPAIKALLLECLEEHYGSLAAVCPQPGAEAAALREIQAILDRVNR